MSKLLESLNADQRRAVETLEGPLLVLAGAGTGKTRVITVRTVHLLGQGVKAENLLLMTFTNKAAREMRERLVGMAGKRAEKVTVGTFHSFCIRLLREHAKKMGLPEGFGICDGSDQITAIKGALRELLIAEADINPRAAQSKISLYKNSLITPDQALDAAADEWEISVAHIFAKYEKHLRRSHVIDFDDFLIFALRLLRENEDVRMALEKRYQYVMVDEYQDTNGPQYGIVHEIVKNHRNLCVVGDDDQSIYGWRGADVSKILGFEKDFHGAEKVHLGMNYRSTVEIIDAANKVIRNNPKRHDKELRSAIGEGSSVAIMRMEDESHEASFICSEIEHLVRAGEAHFRDIAILVRTAQQPRAFEADLRAANIPYQLIGGMSFFDRKEVRDIMSYLRLVSNPADETSFLRIANIPARGIGKTTIDKVIAEATAAGEGAFTAFRKLIESGEIDGSAAKGFAELRSSLNLAVTLAKEGDLVRTIRELIEAVNYRGEIDRIYPDEVTRELRWNGVQEVLNYAENFQRKKSKPTLLGFLEELSLNENNDKDKEDSGDSVTLMTLHSAKGLEFRRVYLVGVEEGILPHIRSASEGSVDEERRLMYVGVTRAQHDLTITYCESRAKFGRLVPCHPSRFLFEMKEKTPPEGWIAAGPAQMVQTAAPVPRDKDKPKAKKKVWKKRKPSRR
ncbi:MAG: UvrD-helicase domain-containing protein [Planctomycetota bacterium]|nr:UvrD-helicase domain-containing protein [Planctomycetota bacterium]MDA1114594.1 UvrD-helicase domain-containing protein [Planctomycetota bacterium]